MRDESVNFDTTKNLFIEGDNLEALKLLQESYLGKVKLIYIDPPYNTGHDFVYKDSFAESREEYMERTGQVDDVGTRLVANPESNGRFHSIWLSMMYPRLKLARNLLADDGVVVVSIDEDEMPRLRQLMDEIFGLQNFYACVCWQKKYAPANDAKRFSDVHDYLLIYARSESFVRNLFPRTEGNNKPYRFDDGDGRGRYRTGDLSVRTYSAENDYPVVNPLTGISYNPPRGLCWRFSESRFLNLVKENRIYWGADGKGAPQLKRYLSDVQQGTVPTTLWTHEFAGHTDHARKEIRYLFDTTGVFDTPKPTKLIRRVLEMSTSAQGSQVVLDFFAGSSTTAHAVMAANAADGGNRRFIMVQLDEAPDPKSEAAKQGYASIAELSRERIRRAGRKILEDSGKSENDLDIGFRSFTISSTNMRDVFAAPDATHQLELDALASNIKPGRTGEDLLFQIMLAWGLELSLPIAVETIAGHTVHSVDDDALLACFDEEVSPELIRAMAERHPLRAVFRDDAFTADAERINAEQIFREVSVSTESKVI